MRPLHDESVELEHRLSKKRLRMSTYRLEKLFTPRSIAIAGISPRPDSVGHIILKNLQSGGFPGELYLVDEDVAGGTGVGSVYKIVRSQ